MSTPQKAAHIDVAAACRELAELPGKAVRSLQRIAALTEDQLAIATAPKDEVYREDMMRLYRYRPTVEREQPIAVLISYALVGRYQMIDLEAERSFVRKLLGRGLRVYAIDWGEPQRQHRWLTIDDYVSGYIDACVDVICAAEGVDKVNLLGVCQGGVMSLCYAALFPEKVRNLVLTVTPIDFHGDKLSPGPGGHMNKWARALAGGDIDRLIDSMGSVPGPQVGLSFLMMSPMGNLAKYGIELMQLADDDRKLLNFMHMERWLADRPDTPGEFTRQWFKDLYQDNKLIRNQFELGGRRVDLDRVTMPVLNVIADGDVVVPTACSRGQAQRFGSRDYTELSVPGGHIGTFVGGKAQAILAPAIADWLEARTQSSAGSGVGSHA